MQLVFSWRQDLRPLAASTSSTGEWLCCLLMDDGGVGRAYTIAESAAAASRLDAVERGEIAAAEWDRETFRAEIGQQDCSIWSLLRGYDDKPLEAVPTATFKLALHGWLGFLRSEPKADARWIVEMPSSGVGPEVPSS